MQQIGIPPITTPISVSLFEPEFHPNKQIEQLRREFKLTAKKFSNKQIEKNSEETNIKLVPQPQSEFSHENNRAGPEISASKQVIPIIPQFLQKHETGSPQLLRTTQQPQHDIYFQQDFNINPVKKPMQKFNRNKPKQANKPDSLMHHNDQRLEPLRHLKKISEDFKFRAAQPSLRARSQPIVDQRIRQQQKSRKLLKLKEEQQGPSLAELKHFEEAEAQIAKAIQLQECINNPSSCQV